MQDSVPNEGITGKPKSNVRLFPAHTCLFLALQPEASKQSLVSSGCWPAILCRLLRHCSTLSCKSYTTRKNPLTPADSTDKAAP